MKKTVAALAILIVLGLYVTYKYNQLFIQDSPTTATSGIIFQKTLNLDQYKLVSNGNGFIGRYSRYSRSDRHDEVLTIYCKEFCPK